MDEFEQLLSRERQAVERYVRFRINAKADADDVLQEIFLLAYRKFDQLKRKEAFRAWLISIARNQCNNHFARKPSELSIEAMEHLSDSRYGIMEASDVRETLELLSEKDRQILQLYFWQDMPQAEIARYLHIPPGTVKSRLHTAKQHFKKHYPYHQGAIDMKKMPKLMPEYRIEERKAPPFNVKWEELMGWFLVPKLGEELTWGMYYMPSGKCSHVYDMKVTGKAKVHGIEGVELTAREQSCTNPKDTINRVFVAQLTDTHCRYLATLRHDGDVHNYITFLDTDAFYPNWGFGEDNCGNETNLTVKGDIQRNGTVITTCDKLFKLDVVGRYDVTINGKTYDTICVMDVDTYNCGVVSEQFLDANGKTILWRRFNRDDWAIERYHQKWSDQLPDNDRLTVNGVTYVHWYDCITDYIL